MHTCLKPRVLRPSGARRTLPTLHHAPSPGRTAKPAPQHAPRSPDLPSQGAPFSLSPLASCRGRPGRPGPLFRGPLLRAPCRHNPPPARRTTSLTEARSQITISSLSLGVLTVTRMGGLASAPLGSAMPPPPTGRPPASPPGSSSYSSPPARPARLGSAWHSDPPPLSSAPRGRTAPPGQPWPQRPGRPGGALQRGPPGAPRVAQPGGGWLWLATSALTPLWDKGLSVSPRYLRSLGQLGLSGRPDSPRPMVSLLGG